MHNNVLQFDTEELFNYEELHYYDEDGQRGFLAYLIKTEEWKVIDNKQENKSETKNMMQ